MAGHGRAATGGERRAFAALALLALAYVALRAARVPWVHDECASLYWYVERGQWLPGLAHWDANNHVLSTLVGLVAYKAAGLSLLGSRIGSVLAFIAWALAVWRVGAFVRDDLARGAARAALLLCPFLLDFFSLFRGYGIELAAWLWAIDGALRFAEHRTPRALAAMLLALLVANAAVLALVPLWAILVAAAAAFALWSPGIQRRGPMIAAAILLGLVPLAAAAWLSFALQERGLLYHGNRDGFVQVSIASLGRYALGSASHVLAWSVMALMLLALAVGAWRRKRALLLCAGLFWADAASRVLLAHLLGVNYPEDRAALHLLPLIVLSLALTADALAAQASAWRWSALLLLALPVRTLLHANTERTLLWPEQSIPRSMADGLALARAGLGRPLVLGSYHQTFLSVPYAMRASGHEAIVPQSAGFPDGLHDVRLADARFVREARTGCTELGADGPLTWLTCDALRGMALMAERLLQLAATDAEFIELLHPDTLVPGASYAIELDAALESDGHLDLHLVVELGEEEGRSAYRDDAPFALFRPAWGGQRLRLMRTFTARRAGTRQVAYLWNPARSGLRELSGALRLWRIGGD